LKLDSVGHRLKVLVNSAGTIKHDDLQKISLQDWDAMLDINLRATLLVTQQAVSRMAEGGVIVNITEAGVGKIWTGFPAYLVSKVGLETLTRLQAKCNCARAGIAPGSDGSGGME
jgi:3-oxoacyl-[acyl-carrier protein] reductase